MRYISPNQTSVSLFYQGITKPTFIFPVFFIPLLVVSELFGHGIFEFQPTVKLSFNPQWDSHNFPSALFFVAIRFLILICPFLQPGEDDLRYASCSKVDMHTKSQCKPCIVSEHEMDMQWSEVFQREWVHMSHRSSFMKMLEVWVWGVRRGPLWVQMLLPLHTLGYVCHVGLYAKYAWILSWVAMQKKTPCSLQITFLQFRLSPKKKLIISPFCYPCMTEFSHSQLHIHARRLMTANKLLWIQCSTTHLLIFF